jgi:fused signal recognition particle receptor
VNGAGKTTFIGKLAQRIRGFDQRVVIAAGDTFRAGAIDQLRVWAERSGADFIGAARGRIRRPWRSTPSSGHRARADFLIIDTAGRLHTSEGLMTELKKVARVIAKRLPMRRTRRCSCSTARSVRTRCSRPSCSPPPCRSRASS